MFKCQEGYTLRKIKGVSYILPFGQQIADQRKGTILNETSAFLWNVIQHNEGANLEMLTEMLARRYGLEEDLSGIMPDITRCPCTPRDRHLCNRCGSCSPWEC